MERCKAIFGMPPCRMTFQKQLEPLYDCEKRHLGTQETKNPVAHEIVLLFLAKGDTKHSPVALYLKRCYLSLLACQQCPSLAAVHYWDNEGPLEPKFRCKQYVSALSLVSSLPLSRFPSSNEDLPGYSRR